MQADPQEEADLRLTEALAASGARDPRDEYRGLLRELKGRGESEYEVAVADYRTSVLEATANGSAEPIRAWLEFGCRLANRLRPGHPVVLDAAGRASPYEPPPAPDALILHLPDKKGRGVLVGAPRELSDAQSAAVELLVLGRVKLK